ncbi:uncharacterized protein VTP21DRAFT_9843 [Calcarisporiella thermophila]|uniref:uncharacterized protein n=1 Tax=Calcarisporiella thermophila TaxID=911321 RepID=UPI003743D8FB
MSSESKNLGADGPKSREELKQHKKELKKMRQIRKQARRVNTLQSRLALAQQLTKAVAASSTQRQPVVISIDIESWEQDHSLVTEFGWSIYNPHSPIPTYCFMDRHFVVAEYKTLRNGRWVADNKYQFRFGTSVVAPLRIVIQELERDFEAFSLGGQVPVILVGHDITGDLKYMENVGVILPAKPCWDNPRGTGDELICFDTADLFSAWRNRFGHGRISLINMLQELGLEEVSYLHNAGNDAHYTLEAFLRMCGVF